MNRDELDALRAEGRAAFLLDPRYAIDIAEAANRLEVRKKIAVANQEKLREDRESTR